MGSPLGPTFANFYMGHLEDNIFSDPTKQPNIYARFIDDIFVQVKDSQQLANLQNTFQQNSVLKFTYELNVNNKLPFLDLLIDNSQNTFKTEVYHKPTNTGQCLNGNSQCPQKYLNSVIHSYIHRAYKASSTWETFHREIQLMKQTLVNNNYSNALIDLKIKQYLENIFRNEQNNRRNDNEIKIYYKNQMHDQYKIEERVIKEIILNSTKCNNPNKKLKIVFYYKNKKTSNLVMKNNLNQPLEPLHQSNIIYKFTCPMLHGEATESESKPHEYIGYSQCTMRKRLQNHTYQGSIKTHFLNSHNISPNLEQLTNNTKIINKGINKQELLIKEALHIKQQCPLKNKQYDAFPTILKLFNNNRQLNNNSTLNSTPLNITNNPAAIPGNEPQDLHDISQAHNSSNIQPTAHAVSPNIRNRINSFVNSIRNNHNTQPPSPPLTRLRAGASTRSQQAHN